MHKQVHICNREKTNVIQRMRTIKLTNIGDKKQIKGISGRNIDAFRTKIVSNQHKVFQYLR